MRIAIIFILLIASGCDSEPRSYWVTDQTLRQELFIKCLDAVPKGPERTEYNDWAEVVEECNSASRYQANCCAMNCKHELEACKTAVSH